jgi:hypothetical protein
MFWMKKATAAAFVLFATFALGAGIGLSTRTEHMGAIAQDKAPGGPDPQPLKSAPKAERYLTIRVPENNSGYPYRVQEYVKSKKGEWSGIGEVGTTDSGSLSLLLSRAAKDEHGPTEARILFDERTPYQRHREAIVACKGAGFQQVMVGEEEWNGGANLQLPENKPTVTTLQTKEDFDKYLKKLDESQQPRPAPGPPDIIRRP